MTGTGNEIGAGSLPHDNSHTQQHMETFPLELQDEVLAIFSFSLSFLRGNFDPSCIYYWELKVDKELEEYDLSKKQIIFLLPLVL